MSTADQKILTHEEAKAIIAKWDAEAGPVVRPAHLIDCKNCGLDVPRTTVNKKRICESCQHHLREIAIAKVKHELS